MASLQKNVAGQKVTFCLVNASTGAALTSATFTSLAWVTVDGTQAGFAGSFTTLGNGQFQYAPTQGETNGTDIGILITPSGAVPVNLDFHTDVVDSNGLLQVDVVDIAGSALSTSTAQFGVNLVNVAGSALSTHASGMVPADVRDIAGSAVSTASAQLGVNAVNIAGQAAALDGNNLLKVDVEDIHGVALAAQALAQSTQSICWGTCSGGTTATAVVSTLNNPSSLTASGQLIGRTIIFLGNSATGGIQAQASNITASTTGSTPTITFTAMTTAPANADVFVIL